MTRIAAIAPRIPGALSNAIAAAAKAGPALGQGWINDAARLISVAPTAATSPTASTTAETAMAARLTFGADEVDDGGVQIRDHHQRAIERLADAYRDDPEYRGIIIGGSVAKGYARDDSDVDFMIIATDEAFERRLAARDLFINRRDLCDYDGGFVDGKIINLAHLEDVADRGNEPSRAAFEGAFVAYSHIADLDALIRNIPVYPEAGHDERIRAFYSMAFIQHWLFLEAERHDNRYTMTRATSQLALFAARLILAHNRRLFPYHKWLPKALESAPEKPDDLMTCFDDLLNKPRGDAATSLFERVRDFADWGVSDLEAYTWFMTDVEWSWMSGTTPIEDW